MTPAFLTALHCVVLRTHPWPQPAGGVRALLITTGSSRLLPVPSGPWAAFLAAPPPYPFFSASSLPSDSHLRYSERTPARCHCCRVTLILAQAQVYQQQSGCSRLTRHQRCKARRVLADSFPEGACLPLAHTMCG